MRTQTFVGNYVSPAQGEGIEPGDIRPFAPGDHVRHVNWRATLRLGTLHVTQHHRERNADVVLLLDTLSEVGPSGATVVDVAVRAAATLAAAYLARKDRVGLIEYGGQLRWVRPGSGRAQLQRLLDTLLDASVVFTYVTRDVDLIPPRILPPQALVLALSPLLDARFVRAAADLAARRFDLVVIAVSPVAAARAAVPAGPGRRPRRAALDPGAPRAARRAPPQRGDHRRLGRRRTARRRAGLAASAAPAARCSPDDPPGRGGARRGRRRDPAGDPVRRARDAGWQSPRSSSAASGALTLSVSLVTAGASLALIAYAVALTLARPAADPLASVAFGGTLVLLLALVHFAARIDGAVVGPGVLAGQIRHWMVIVALGVAAAAVLTLGGAVLAPLLVGATLPSSSSPRRSGPC